MTRRRALLVLELRLERRYGIHAAGAVVAAVWTGLLMAAPAEVARAVTPFVLFVDSATVGGFLLAGMVLFERSERTLTAVMVTPVRTVEYLAARTLALTALSVVVALPVALAGGRGDVRLGPVLLGVTATALLVLLVCALLVAPHRSVTAFLSVAPWPLAPLLAIPLLRTLGLLEHPVASMVPTVAALDLLTAGFDTAVQVSPIALAYLLAWVIAFGYLAVRRVESTLRARG